MEKLEQKRFNKLIAQKPLFRYRREWVWLCKCDCGKETNVRISKLKNGTTKSCGCLKNKNLTYSKQTGSSHGNWQGYKDISMTFYSRIKQTARQRGIEFSVSIEYLWELFENQNGLCLYTGNKLTLPVNVRQLRGEGNEMVASLDRIDSGIGYVEGNLQWVCKRVNYMKHAMNNDYFLEWIKSIYEFKNLK